VLLLQAGPDRSGDYVSVMNAIFVAQRQSVLLDAVQLGPQHSLFLRQAAYVTHSLYAQIPLAAPLLPPRADADATAAAATTAVDSLRVRPPSSPLMLLQHLFTSLLAPAPLRPLLQLRHTQTVDLRATCFCHSRPVEQAHVCPVCLAVYCQAKMQCPSCGSRFLGSGPLRGKVLAKPKPKNPSAAPATATAAPAHAGAGADTDAGSSAGATAGAGAGAGMVRRAPDTALEGGAAVKRAPLALSLKR
jgi:transcription initiation factor TFIIH subunit 3